MYKLTLSAEDGEVLETWPINPEETKALIKYYHAAIGEEIDIEIGKHMARSNPGNVDSGVELYPWVKKLGQWHQFNGSSATAVCGVPMLGNNYARFITEKDRTKCKECHA